MKKLKILFNVSEAALTAAVFVLVTALVPMDIILKLVSQSVINGNPCLYGYTTGTLHQQSLLSYLHNPPSVCHELP